MIFVSFVPLWLKFLFQPITLKVNATHIATTFKILDGHAMDDGVGSMNNDSFASVWAAIEYTPAEAEKFLNSSDFNGAIALYRQIDLHL